MPQRGESNHCLTGVTTRSAVIAEDDADLRTVLSILLASEGWQVSDGATLDEARRLIDERAPQLLILDLPLSHEVAADLLAELACRTDAPVTVVLSGHDHLEVVAGRYGVACARKPVDVDELMATIDRALARSRRPSLAAASWISLRPSMPSVA